MSLHTKSFQKCMQYKRWVLWMCMLSNSNNNLRNVKGQYSVSHLPMHSLLPKSANVLVGQAVTQVVPLRKYEPKQLVHSLEAPPLQVVQVV